MRQRPSLFGIIWLGAALGVAGVGPARACEAPLTLVSSNELDNDPYRAALAEDFARALAKHAQPLYLKMRTTVELSRVLEAGGKLFLNRAHTAGFGVTNDGELISLFNDTGTRGWGAIALQLARRHGVRYLHCLEPLQAYYENFGFRVEARFENVEMDPERQFHWHRLGQPVPARLRMVLNSF